MLKVIMAAKRHSTPIAKLCFWFIVIFCIILFLSTFLFHLLLQLHLFPSIRYHHSITLQSQITNGVYWSALAEKHLPLSFSIEDDQTWYKHISSASTVHAIEGCGRMQNRRLTLSSGIKSCARYRGNQDQILGEIYTHQLARLLGIGNRPPTCLMRINYTDWRLSPVASALSSHGTDWKEGAVIVITRWIDNIQPAKVPRHFQKISLKTRSASLTPNSIKLPTSKTESLKLAELMQWSDLFVLDYITANLDRYVNSLINMAWNIRIMHEPAHNLNVVPSTGLLLFLDNESGLYHGYRLLDRYQSHHTYSLHHICVFRKSTIDALSRLPKSPNDLGKYLTSSLRKINPEAKHLPQFMGQNAILLRQRIDDVLHHVEKCKNKYT